MSLDLRRFSHSYPWLWHVTSAANAARIARTRRIDPAEALLRAAGRADLVAVRRKRDLTVEVDGEPVVLRDQAPLLEGHIRWEQGWDLSRFVTALNQRVFFWPGRWDRPSSRSGANGAAFLGISGVVAVLVPTEAILDLEAIADAAGLTPKVELSRYNTGGPRTTAGVKSPRGDSTFVPLGAWEGPPSLVREVAVAGALDLGSCWDRIHIRQAHDGVDGAIDGRAPIQRPGGQPVRGPSNGHRRAG